MLGRKKTGEMDEGEGREEEKEGGEPVIGFQ